jgi:hypothetical protein
MKSKEKQLSNSALKSVRKTSAGDLVRPAFSAGAALDTLKETPTGCASPTKRATAAVTWSTNVINNSNKAHRQASLSAWKTAGEFQLQP